jgi:hypothetical protein
MEMVLVASYAIGEEYQIFDIFRQSNTIEITQAKTLKIEPKEEKKDRVKEIAEDIWNRESTKGQHNYSKCEAIGKVNGIGYGIAGNGKYLCFESHEDEMRVLEGWIIAKFSAKYTERDLLCIYSGNNYKECK